MYFQISRNGQMYGPYTLEDLRRYVASGNVLPNDFAKSDVMTEWLPVSSILAAGGAPPAAAAHEDPTPGYTPVAAQPEAGAGPLYRPLDCGAAPYGAQPNPAATAASPYADPPNLHWGLVLLFSLLTCTFFMYFWNLIVAAWLKRVQPNATSIFYYAGAGVLAIVQGFFFVHHPVHHSFGPGFHSFRGNSVGNSLGLLVWIVRLIARFTQRASLEEHYNTVEPMGLQLNGVLTFFFGGLYFQYKLNEINAVKQAARYAAGVPRGD